MIKHITTSTLYTTPHSSNVIKFEHDDDKLFIKALLRSAKETNTLYSCGQTIEDIYKKCLISRKTHPTESTYNNAMYWAVDCGLFNIGRA